MERWTNREEAKLQRLMQRKNDLTAKNMKPLIELVDKRLSITPSMIVPIANILADNADAFRDALEPFDSGIRPAERGDSEELT